MAYLNGVEVASRNAPAAPTWNSLATTTNSDTKAVVFESIDLGDVNSLLRQGSNVLAIHGMNRTIADSDLLFDVELVGEKTLTQRNRVPLKFNEVAAADAGPFFVEITNDGQGPIDLTGFGLGGSGYHNTTLCPALADTGTRSIPGRHRTTIGHNGASVGRPLFIARPLGIC